MKNAKMILFKSIASKKDLNLNQNSIATLDNLIISGTVERDLTGLNILEATLLLTEETKSIENGMLLKVLVDGNYDFFRITALEIDDIENTIFIYGRNKALADSKDIWIEDNTPEGLTCGQTIEYLRNHSVDKDRQYCKDIEVESNIKGTATSNYFRKSLYDCIYEDDNSIMVKFNNPEIQFIQNTIRLLDNIGNKTPMVTLQSKKNITGFTVEEDIDTVINRFKPVGYDGVTIAGDYGDYIEGRNIKNFPTIRTEVFKYDKVRLITEDDDRDNLDPEYEWYDSINKLRQRLVDLMTKEIEKNNYDTLMGTYTINFIELSKYSDYEQARVLRLGDNAYVTIPELNNLIITVRCSGIRYDIKEQEIQEVTLTNKPIEKLSAPNLQTIISIIEKTPTADEILEQAKEEVLQQMKDGLNNSYVIVKQNVIYIGDSPNIANMQNVIIMNKNGISFSNTGVNGTPNVGITISGSIVADRVTSGVLSTILIRSLDGSSWINLTDGTYNFSNNMTLLKNADGTKTFKLTLSDGTNLEDKLKDTDDKLKDVVTSSELTATANEIKLSVGESGAYNMVKNSRAEINTNFWHGTVSRYGNSSSAKLTNGTYFRVDNDTTTEKYMRSDTFAVKPNTTYTLALTVMRSAYCKNIDIHFLGFKDKSKVDTNQSGYDYVHTVVANKVYAEGVWVKEVVTFTTKSDELCGYLRFDNNGSSSAGTLCKAYFTDILMYEGVIKNSNGNIIAKPWTPYPAELYGASVVVDKRGMEVKDINGTRVFRADTKDGVSLTGDLLQYDADTGNYSLEISKNMINFYDRWDSLGNHKNNIGYIGSTQVNGSYFGYNIGNTDNTRVGLGIIADVGDFVALCSKDANGNNNPMFIMENSDGLNINQGNRFGFMQDVAFLNGAYPKWYGTLHNFIGDIHFDSNSKMNIWGTGGINFICNTAKVLEATDTGVTVYGQFTDSSDAAFKSNIKPLDLDTMQIVKDIDIYRYKENGGIEIGLLAQEAVKVIPDIIKGTPTNTTIQEANNMSAEEREEKLKNGGASVDVYSMLSILWDANKKLIEKVEEMQEEINKLK